MKNFIKTLLNKQFKLSNKEYILNRSKKNIFKAIKVRRKNSKLINRIEKYYTLTDVDDLILKIHKENPQLKVSFEYSVERIDLEVNGGLPPIESYKDLF